MASFTYQRLTTAGLPERGMLRLASGDPMSAMEYLERDGSMVLNVAYVPAMLRLWARLRVYGFQRVSRSEASQFLETLASYLGSGIALSDALSDLRSRVKVPELRQIISHMLVDVQSGMPLSAAMARHEHVFSPVLTIMVSVGEEAGELPAQTKAAAAHLRHMDEIAKLARRTLAYPLITLTILLGVFLFWVVVVVPALADTFDNLGRDLPGVMQTMLQGSAFLRVHGLTLLAGVGLGVLLIWLIVKKSKVLRRWMGKVAIRLPFIGPVLAQAATARALELLGVLLGNGVAPDKSLTLVCKATHNAHYRDILERAHRLVSGGMPLSEALGRGKKGFDDAALRLLHAGERTGRLKEQCEVAAAVYRRQLNHSVLMLSKIVEPFLLVVFTLLLAFFILGFLAPIYETLGAM